MPLYMDRHELSGATADDLASAHLMDVEVQTRHGVEYLNYWFDYERQQAFCLAKGPSAEAVDAVHRESHGQVANRVIEVDETEVRRFMGSVASHVAGEVHVDSAFRVILFTDLEGSTRLTQERGDAAAMTILRRHDALVRDAVEGLGGTIVKHTGDGVMASFQSAAAAVEAAVRIQQALTAAAASGEVPLAVRVGLAAGEPVAAGDDLFGAVVQLAARLCAKATPRSVLVASSVRDLAVGKGFAFGAWRTLRLKGFPESVRACEVVWSPPAAGEG